MPTPPEKGSLTPQPGLTRWLALLPTAVTVAIELAVWIVADSLAMLAGGAHLLVDLVIGVASRLSASQNDAPQRAKHRGRLQSILLGSTAIVLVFVFFQVVMRGPHRLLHPVAVDGAISALTAPLGLLISLIWLGGAVPCNGCPRRANPARWVGTLAAATVCVGVLLVVATGDHRIDTIAALIVMILLLPRLLILTLRH